MCVASLIRKFSVIIEATQSFLPYRDYKVGKLYTRKPGDDEPLFAVCFAPSKVWGGMISFQLSLCGLLCQSCS